jgi:serine/threonine-protein kinase
MRERRERNRALDAGKGVLPVAAPRARMRHSVRDENTNISVGAPLTKYPLLESNTEFGRYVIEKELGQGAMGIVFKAYDPLIERPVAIKTLKLDLQRKDLAGFRERFLLEAKSAGRLNHPNIVTIYDVGEKNGTAYLAMEYLNGRELKDLLAERSAFSFRQIAEIIQQIADALAYAHSNGVIHRDIKPANIMIVRDGMPKVLDFGIAQLPTGTKNEEGTVIGSPRYMAPEQIQNQIVDGRSDIYSLGAVMYEMLAGRAPFEADTLATTVFMVLNEMPVPPEMHSRNTPHVLSRIAGKALAKNPADRYQSAAEMAEELRRYSVKAEAKATLGNRKTSADAAPNLVPAPGGQATERKAAKASAELAKTVLILPPSAEDKSRKRPKAGKREKAAKDHAAGANRWLTTPVLAALGVGAVALVLGIVGLTIMNENAPRPLVTPLAEEPRAESPPTALQAVNSEPASVSVPAAPAVVEDKPLPAAPKAPPPSPMAPRTVMAAADNALPKQSPRKSKSRSIAPEAAAPATVPDAKGLVRFAVAPWGEIYVDGARAGISPPLSELQVAAGRHQIEIRNGDAAPYRAEVEVSAAEPARIKHKFE